MSDEKPYDASWFCGAVQLAATGEPAEMSCSDITLDQ